MAYAFKLMREMEWQKFAESLMFFGSTVDVKDGFIHLSYADQLAETARKHFSGQADLILCAVDCAILGDALKNEPSRHGQLFPHLYRPLHWREVFWHTSLHLDPDGVPILPVLPPENRP